MMLQQWMLLKSITNVNYFQRLPQQQCVTNKQVLTLQLKQSISSFHRQIVPLTLTCILTLQELFLKRLKVITGITRTGKCENPL